MLRIFSVAILVGFVCSRFQVLLFFVSPHVCFILALLLMSMFLR